MSDCLAMLGAINRNPMRTHCIWVTASMPTPWNEGALVIAACRHAAHRVSGHPRKKVLRLYLAQGLAGRKRNKPAMDQRSPAEPSWPRCKHVSSSTS